MRFIVASLKINNDLERIGDLAVNVARKAVSFASQLPMEIPFNLAGMGEKTQEMLRDSLDALVNLDPKLANNVCARDDEVDRMKRAIRVRAEEMMRAEPDHVSPSSRSWPCLATWNGSPTMPPTSPKT